MKTPKGIAGYDSGYRGQCPTESAEQMTFFNKIRGLYPDTIGLIATHIKNEGARSYGQVAIDKAMGLTTGAPDVIIPGSPCFVCELKRKDRTKSRLQPAQEPYLLAAKKAGAFVCVAYGWEQAMIALNDWINICEIKQ